MGIFGKVNITVKTVGILFDPVHNSLCFFTAETAGYKILLHIYNDQRFLHSGILLYPLCFKDIIVQDIGRVNTLFIILIISLSYTMMSAT